MSLYVHAWAIRSREKKVFIWGRAEVWFSRRHRSPQNRHHLWVGLDEARLFATKNEAETYFFKKVRAGCDMKDCMVSRLKILLTKQGKWDCDRNLRRY